MIVARVVAAIVATTLATYLVLEIALPGAIAAAATAAATGAARTTTATTTTTTTAAVSSPASAPRRICAPVALVHGPRSAAPMRAAIEARLRADGMGSDPGTCPDLKVRANVAPHGGTAPYVLDIEDAFGRRSRRRFDDAGTAASLIESFAFPEDSEVLRARSAPAGPEDGAPRTTTPPAPPTAVLSATAASPLTPEPPGGASHVRIDANLGTLAASDRSIWYGGNLSFCARVESFCVGGRAEIARDAASTGPATDGVNPTRTTGALLLALGRPLRATRFSLTPLVAVGVDWMRVAIDAQDQDPAVSADVFGLRAEGILAGALRLTPSWAIGAELVASVGRALGRSASAGFASAASDNPGVDTNPRVGVRLGLGVEYTR